MSYQVRLQEALKAKGMTSNALSRQLKVSSTAVWNWMHGNTEPRPEMLIKVAEELGVSPNWLKDGHFDQSGEQSMESKSPQSTVQEVLTDAKAKLALILQVPEHRIRLELNLNA